jgi:hypothetical protein
MEKLMEKYIFSFVLIILTVSCVHKTNETVVVSFTSGELDIINQIIKTINQENQIVIINDNLEITYTTQDNNRNDIYKYLRRTKKVENDLLGSFKRNNNKKAVLKKNIVFDFNFIWNRPYEYNNGIITFSKIGFNKEQTKAIIYIGIMTGSEGKGDYYILEKEKDAWKIVAIIGGWIT